MVECIARGVIKIENHPYGVFKGEKQLIVDIPLPRYSQDTPHPLSMVSSISVKTEYEISVTNYATVGALAVSLIVQTGPVALIVQVGADMGHCGQFYGGLSAPVRSTAAIQVGCCGILCV